MACSHLLTSASPPQWTLPSDSNRPPSPSLGSNATSSSTQLACVSPSYPFPPIHPLLSPQIGAKRDELKTLYELDPNWQPFPTYPLVLTFKGDSPELNNFGEMQKASGRPQGLPVLDPVPPSLSFAFNETLMRERRADEDGAC